MLRLLFTRRWLIGALAAIVFAVACFFLGRWQWTRFVDKQTKATAIATNYDAPATPLAAVLPAASLLPERQWTHVTLRGTYATGEDLLVRNRTLDSTVGFEVLTPLLTSEGATVLVDRGWVPNGEDAETTPPVDPAPADVVTVTGWLRSGEPDLDRQLPPPQLSSISITQARAAHPEVGVADVYVVLGSQTPAATHGRHPVAPLPRPVQDLGPHQAYAIQWWLTMPGGLIFVVWAMRRELLQAEPERVKAATKPKKVRIWDEEDG